MLGGVQAGYNWQSGNFVYGLEGDFDGSSLIVKNSVTGSFPIVGGGTTTGTFSSKEILNSLGTIRGRVGLSRGATLFYVTGGLAYGSVQLENNISSVSQGSAYPNSANEILAGWTAGGGVEWAFLPHWSVRAEGLYYDLGDYNLTTAINGFTAGSRFSVNGWVARAGLNYNFGEPPVLAKY